MQNCMLSCFVAWIVLVYSTTLAKNQQRFIIFHVQFGGSKWVRFLVKKSTYIQWPSSSEIFHILLGKLAYFIIRFLLNCSIVKSYYFGIGKKVITDELGQYFILWVYIKALLLLIFIILILFNVPPTISRLWTPNNF